MESQQIAREAENPPDGRRQEVVEHLYFARLCRASRLREAGDTAQALAEFSAALPAMQEIGHPETATVRQWCDNLRAEIAARTMERRAVAE